MQQSDIELTVYRFSKIEQRLVNDLGATEKNGSSRTSFIDRLSEVEHLFTAASTQRLRSIASLRNKLVHGDITSLPDREQFIKDCDMIDMAIDLAKEKRETFAGDRNTIFSSTRPVSKIRKNPNRELRRTPDVVVFFAAILVLLLVTVIYHFSQPNSLNNDQLNPNGSAVPERHANDAKERIEENRQATLTEIKKEESVQVEVTNKGIESGSFDEFLFCKVTFSNLTDKNITGIRGNLEVMDSKENVLHVFSVFLNAKFDGKLKAKSSFVKRIGDDFGFDDDYSEFDEKDRLYKNTPLDNMKFSWQPEQIVYEDGTETAR